MPRVLLLCFFLCAFAEAEAPPWAASQPIDSLTGLVLPHDWAKRAGWTTSFQVDEKDLPQFFDWRFYAHSLTPVKRQRAGDCWAQGTVGVLESLVKIELATETDLSVQEVISCSGEGTAAFGGYFAHEYHVAKGAAATIDFPYVARDVSCKTGLRPVYRLARWGFVGKEGTAPTVVQMKQALMEHGPIGVTIFANAALQNFQGDGVFRGCGKGQTNHIEVIVGWDDSEGGGVWFVRNSWGKDHGEDGYAKIPYGCSRVGEISTWADLRF